MYSRPAGMSAWSDFLPTSCYSMICIFLRCLRTVVKQTLTGSRLMSFVRLFGNGHELTGTTKTSNSILAKLVLRWWFVTNSNEVFLDLVNCSMMSKLFSTNACPYSVCSLSRIRFSFATGIALSLPSLSRSLSITQGRLPLVVDAHEVLLIL